MHISLCNQLFNKGQWTGTARPIMHFAKVFTSHRVLLWKSIHDLDCKDLRHPSESQSISFCECRFQASFVLTQSKNVCKGTRTLFRVWVVNLPGNFDFTVPRSEWRQTEVKPFPLTAPTLVRLYTDQTAWHVKSLSCMERKTRLHCFSSEVAVSFFRKAEESGQRNVPLWSAQTGKQWGFTVRTNTA